MENARGDLVPYYPLIDEKPTVAYLWARTIPCQDPRCGGTIPLLKTLWVCTKAEKTLPDTPENRKRPDFLRLKKTKKQTKVIVNGKRALKLCPDTEMKQVRFEIVVPKDADDVGEPTMSGATATCPFCGSQQPDDYIKQCGHEAKLKAQMTTVVYQEGYGKEYRPPTQPEIDAAEVSEEALGVIANQIPHSGCLMNRYRTVIHQGLGGIYVPQSTALRNGQSVHSSAVVGVDDICEMDASSKGRDGEVQLFIGVGRSSIGIPRTSD